MRSPWLFLRGPARSFSGDLWKAPACKTEVPTQTTMSEGNAIALEVRVHKVT